jgi:hydrogenase expression/formation protein HypC
VKDQHPGPRRASVRSSPISDIMCLAIPGLIVELDARLPRIAVVEVSGVRRKVDLGLLADDMPGPGDWVLIHVGFAMSRVSAEEADEQMRLLRMLGEADAAMEEVRGYGIPDAERPGEASTR